MNEKKHKVDFQETHANKQKNDEERIAGNQPADVLRQVREGPPSTLTPAKILALQRTVGNQVVQRLINRRSRPGVLQRHVPPAAEEAFNANSSRLSEGWNSMGQSVRGADDNISQAISLNGPMVQHYNSMLDAHVSARDYDADGGEESQSTQEG